MIYTALTYLLCPIFIKLAHSIGVLDYPDGVRKFQAAPVARLGGVAILFSLLLPLLSEPIPHPGAILAFVILLFCATLDDLFSLSPLMKLFMQAFSCVLLVGSFGLLGNITFFGISLAALPPTLAFFSELFVALLLINGFNLIDGVDGLCATVATFSFTMTFLFLQAPLALCIAFAALGFLPYNLKSRMYLGEIGTSLFGSFGVYFILSSSATAGAFRLELLFLFALPVLEVLTSFLRRLFLLKNPFSADKMHLHHVILSLGASKHTVNLIALFLSLLSALPLIYSYLI